MRTLVFAQYFPPDTCGSSTRASNVVNGLLSKNCDVTIVAAFPHYPRGEIPSRYRRKLIAPERFGSGKVFRVWVPSLAHTTAFNRILLHFCFVFSSLFALPFVGKVDVIWGASPNLFSFFSCVVYGAIKRVPIVRNVDDLWPEVFYEMGYVKSKLAQKILDLLAWFSYVVPAAITPISESYKRKIVAKYGVPPSKVHVIEVGVNSIQPLDESNCSNDQFVLMYSGVLNLGYDFDLVLETARLLKKYKDIVFMIRGFGEVAPRLERLIVDLGLSNVVLDTRFLPKNELSFLLSSADVFLLPMPPLDFVDQGLPTKIFEYQSYGKPIICVSNGESARYVRLTNSGLVSKPSDPEALAQTVLRLYADRKLGRCLGSNGWKYVSENLTPPHLGEYMYNLFCKKTGALN